MRDVKLLEVRTGSNNQRQNRQVPGTLAPLDHAAQIAQPEHIEKNVQRVEVNEHRREQPPNLTVADLRQAQVGRNVTISGQERADEQTLDSLEVHYKLRADKNDNAECDEYERQRAEAVAGQRAEQVTPVAQPVAPGLLAFGALGAQRFRPRCLRVVLRIIGILTKAREQLCGACDLFHLIDPDSPAFPLDEFYLVLDALHKEKIAERAGAGLTLQMTDQAHEALLRFKSQALAADVIAPVRFDSPAQIPRKGGFGCRECECRS